MTMRPLFMLSLTMVVGCKSPDPKPNFQTFGSMREVMREGHNEGRVKLLSISDSYTIGVGALAGLAGEITITDGQVLVSACRNDAAGVLNSEISPVVREAREGDEATLLMVDTVTDWHHFEIGSCRDYAHLEEHISKLLHARGCNLNKPTPVRVTGKSNRLQVHVIAGACPIATPNGPKPWRYDGPATGLKLVGFYIEDAAGKMTHHNRSSHLHALSDQAMGHLDDVELTDAVVSLPADVHR